MENLFAALIVISLFCFLLSWLFPNTFSPLFRNKLSKGKVRWVFGLSTIVFFVLFGIISNTKNPLPKDQGVVASQEKTQTADQQSQQQVSAPAQQEVANNDQSPQAQADSGTQDNLPAATSPATVASPSSSASGLNVSRDAAIKIFTAEEPGLDFKKGMPIDEPGTPRNGQDNYTASVPNDGVDVQLIGPQENLSQIAVTATIDKNNAGQLVNAFNLLGVSAGLVKSSNEANHWLDSEVKNYPYKENTAYNHSKTFGNYNYDIQSTPILDIPMFILTITAASH